MTVDHATDRKNRKPRCTLQRGFSLSKKSIIACEASFYYPFFAPGLPGQKTLLSQQVYWKRLRLIPYARSLHFIEDKMRKAWLCQARRLFRRKSPFRGFFDGLKPRCTLQRGFLNNGGLSEGIDERFGVGRIGEIVCAVILDEHYLEPGVKLCDI